jgi:hypothetical protein
MSSIFVARVLGRGFNLTQPLLGQATIGIMIVMAIAIFGFFRSEWGNKRWRMNN